MRTTLSFWFFACCFVLASAAECQQWTKMNPVFDPPGSYRTYQGTFVDKNHGWWITLRPESKLLSTSDGGYTWRKLADGITLECIDFVDTLHGWMTGTLQSEPSELRITRDGGKSWQSYPAPWMYPIIFFDSLVGFAGGNGIYKTTDGGINWQAQSVSPLLGLGVCGIFFLDRKHGWAAGGGSPIGSGFIWGSVDSGKSWKTVDTLGMDWLPALYFTDTLRGYVGGRGEYVAAVMFTTDGGKTWGGQHLESSPNDLVFTDDRTGWMVGYSGYIWHTTDRGVTWNQVASGTSSDLYNVFFFENGSIGYIMGADGTLLRYDETVAVKEQPPSQVKSFEVSQNYPNPFNPLTRISYSLPEGGKVSLVIFDVLGREISSPVNECQRAGRYTVTWNSTQSSGIPVSSGVYFGRLSVLNDIGGAKFTRTIRLLLIR